MRRHLFAPLALAVLLLIFGTMAAACDSEGGELTLEEYFHRFEALGERIEALGTEFGEELDSEEYQLEAFRDWVDGTLRIHRDFTDALGDIDPPVEVKDAHEEFVDARAEFMDVFADLFGEVRSISELEEVFYAPPDPDLVAADERNDQACRTLQDIADANGIDVHLLDYCS